MGSDRDAACGRAGHRGDPSRPRGGGRGAARSGKTSTIACAGPCWRCRRSARGGRTSRSWWSTSVRSSTSATACRYAVSRDGRSGCSSSVPGAATCASWRPILEQAVIFRAASGSRRRTSTGRRGDPRRSPARPRAGPDAQGWPRPNAVLSWLQHEVLRIATERREVRRADLVARCRVSHEVARRALAGLARLRLLRRVGLGRATRYVSLSFWLTFLDDAAELVLRSCERPGSRPGGAPALLGLERGGAVRRERRGRATRYVFSTWTWQAMRGAMAPRRCFTRVGAHRGGAGPGGNMTALDWSPRPLAGPQRRTFPSSDGRQHAFCDPPRSLGDAAHVPGATPGSTSTIFVGAVTGTSSWAMPRKRPSSGAVRTVASIFAEGSPARTTSPICAFVRNTPSTGAYT